ncbi:hypothetical protein AJ87_21270 [Rhizobium yanglingense]|nr:hypothetical protein AJ87_21270 [Rhizobium yanglingense]
MRSSSRSGHSPDARVAARQQTSAAVVTDLFALWQATLQRIFGKSKLAEALRYAIFIAPASNAS